MLLSVLELKAFYSADVVTVIPLRRLQCVLVGIVPWRRLFFSFVFFLFVFKSSSSE